MKFPRTFSGVFIASTLLTAAPVLANSNAEICKNVVKSDLPANLKKTCLLNCLQAAEHKYNIPQILEGTNNIPLGSQDLIESHLGTSVLVLSFSCTDGVFIAENLNSTSYLSNDQEDIEGYKENTIFESIAKGPKNISVNFTKTGVSENLQIEIKGLLGHYVPNIFEKMDSEEELPQDSRSFYETITSKPTSPVEMKMRLKTFSLAEATKMARLEDPVYPYFIDWKRSTVSATYGNAPASQEGDFTDGSGEGLEGEGGEGPFDPMGILLSELEPADANFDDSKEAHLNRLAKGIYARQIRSDMPIEVFDLKKMDLVLAEMIKTHKSGPSSNRTQARLVKENNSGQIKEVLLQKTLK